MWGVLHIWQRRETQGRVRRKQRGQGNGEEKEERKGGSAEDQAAQTFIEGIKKRLS